MRIWPSFTAKSALATLANEREPANWTGHRRFESAMGYVSVAGESLLFPSIGVNAQGQGIIAFTLSGPDFFPSAAYAPIDAAHGAGEVHIAAAGVGPEDGFTGYNSPTVVGFPGNGTARWGDYSAAVAAANGSIWFANEFIFIGS
jgi:hypothetical protein